MPAYTARIAMPGITVMLVNVKKQLNRAGTALKVGFADATRPREGFIRPSSVDLEQDLRELGHKIVNIKIGITTGETSDGEGLQAQKRKTARFESSFGSFGIF